MDEESATGRKAGLLRRLAALLYDLLLVIALAFVTTFAMLPLTGGEAILASTQGALAHLYHVVLVLAVFAYFGWCWTRAGQTLGMKAWRIRLVSEGGRPPGWGDAIVRFTLGAAMTWMGAIGGRYLLEPKGTLQIASACAMLAPLVANFTCVPLESAGRSLLDLAGRLRVVRSG